MVCTTALLRLFYITDPLCFKVQERALKTVPDLCETIDYAEVQSILFPRVAVSVRRY